MLANGPVPSGQVMERAKVDGIKETTLKRAKKKLGVEATKTGFAASTWSWVLPSSPKGATEGGQPPYEPDQMTPFDGKEAKPSGNHEGGQVEDVAIFDDAEDGQATKVGPLRENGAKSPNSARRGSFGQVAGGLAPFGGDSGAAGPYGGDRP